MRSAPWHTSSFIRFPLSCCCRRSRYKDRRTNDLNGSRPLCWSRHASSTGPISPTSLRKQGPSDIIVNIYVFGATGAGLRWSATLQKKLYAYAADERIGIIMLVYSARYHPKRRFRLHELHWLYSLSFAPPNVPYQTLLPPPREKQELHLHIPMNETKPTREKSYEGSSLLHSPHLHGSFPMIQLHRVVLQSQIHHTGRNVNTWEGFRNDDFRNFRSLLDRYWWIPHSRLHSARSSQAMKSFAITDTYKQHSIRNLVFTYPTAKNDHPCLFRMNTHIVQPSDIGYNVDNELIRRFVCMKVYHIAQRTVGQSGTEYRYIILLVVISFVTGIALKMRETDLVTPIVYTLLVIYLLSQAINYGTRRPSRLQIAFLFDNHLI